MQGSILSVGCAIPRAGEANCVRSKVVATRGDAAYGFGNADWSQTPMRSLMIPCASTRKCRPGIYNVCSAFWGLSPSCIRTCMYSSPLRKACFSRSAVSRMRFAFDGAIAQSLCRVVENRSRLIFVMVRRCLRDVMYIYMYVHTSKVCHSAEISGRGNWTAARPGVDGARVEAELRGRKSAGVN